MTLTAPTPASAADEGESLYLVTLAGPGVTGDRGTLTGSALRARLLAAQDTTLAAAGADTTPVYRWTDALNGFAAPLTPAEARAVAAQPEVTLVEPNTVRQLAAAPGRRAPGTSAARSRGGAGVVIGVVDSGIWPESPLFAGAPGLGRQARGFRGECQEGAGWSRSTCNKKIVAARWYVDGFGVDNLSGSATLSPRDESGHGTQVASIAAGNTGVSVRSSGESMGTFSGIAPQARLAVYKACWTAPDPSDDGCATADLVTAVDQAVQDGIDVLNLSVAGPPGADTLERALLGAAESDVVVVAAAGNAGLDAYAAHAAPWVTSVGAVTAAAPLGEVRVAGGPRVRGTMVSPEPARGPHRPGCSGGRAGLLADRRRALSPGLPGRRDRRWRRHRLSARHDRPGGQVGRRRPGGWCRHGPDQRGPRWPRGRRPRRPDSARRPDRCPPALRLAGPPPARQGPAAPGRRRRCSGPRGALVQRRRPRLGPGEARRRRARCRPSRRGAATRR